MKIARVAFSVASVYVSLSIAGCATGYKEFYKPVDGMSTSNIVAHRAGPPPEMPLVEHTQPGNAEAIRVAYMKRGFEMVGYSLFNSGHRETEASAVKQGQEVGADLVLVIDPQYTGSVTTTVPITTPTTSTSYSSGNATAYGSGGSVTAYGNSTTTTYGSTTKYVPITVQRVDYGAVYFVKGRYEFGVHARNLSDAEREQIQSNKGAIVTVVIDGTPAFNADILIGDIIASINGAPVANAEQCFHTLDSLKGTMVAFDIVRHGDHIQKRVQLNP